MDDTFFPREAGALPVLPWGVVSGVWTVWATAQPLSKAWKANRRGALHAGTIPTPARLLALEQGGWPLPSWLWAVWATAEPLSKQAWASRRLVQGEGGQPEGLST